MGRQRSSNSPLGFLFIIVLSGISLVLLYLFVAIPLAKWSQQNVYVIMGLILAVVAIPWIIIKSKPARMDSRKNNRIALFSALLITLCTSGYLLWHILTRLVSSLSSWPIIIIVVSVIIVSILVVVIYKKIRKASLSVEQRTDMENIEVDNTSRRTAIPQNMRQEVYTRAHHCCQYPECQLRDNLMIHHIDKNPSNHALENLIILCPNHHKSADNNIYRKESLHEWNRYSH